MESDRAIDLSEPPFSYEADAWQDPTNYTPCQDLAALAREAQTDIIRTVSVRDVEQRCNVVVLDPKAFAERSPSPGKTWHLRFEEGRLTALAAFPSSDRFVFTAEGFDLQ